MSLRQVVDGPTGEQYVVTADRVALARMLAGADYTAGRDDDRWEVRVVSKAGQRTFSAANSEVAERLMVLLGEELELGLLEL